MVLSHWSHRRRHPHPSHRHSGFGRAESARQSSSSYSRRKDRPPPARSHRCMSRRQAWLLTKKQQPPSSSSSLRPWIWNAELRWASLDRSCDQYGIKLRADHGGSSPGASWNALLRGVCGCFVAVLSYCIRNSHPPEREEFTPSDKTTTCTKKARKKAQNTGRVARSHIPHTRNGQSSKITV